MSRLAIKRPFKVEHSQRGQKRLRDPKPRRDVAPRVPRVAKLMALAIRFEGLVRNGVVADYAELARLGHVSRARMSQICGLLNLAPDIQETILFLPAVERGKDPITERDLRPIVATGRSSGGCGDDYSRPLLVANLTAKRDLHPPLNAWATMLPRIDGNVIRPPTEFPRIHREATFQQECRHILRHGFSIVTFLRCALELESAPP